MALIIPRLERLDRPEMWPTALESDRESSELADLAVDDDEVLSELTEEKSDTPLDLSERFLLLPIRC